MHARTQDSAILLNHNNWPLANNWPLQDVNLQDNRSNAENILIYRGRGLDLSFDTKELSYHPHAHFKSAVSITNFYLPENLTLIAKFAL